MSKGKRRRVRRLSEAQNHRCCYCGCPVEPVWGLANSATLEHVIRRADGGPSHQGNLVVACAGCNNRRGNQDAYDYAAAIALRNRP